MEFQPGAARFEAGELLDGKYRVRHLVGRGGMAQVYAAHHEILDRSVALKVLLPEIASAPGAATRFLNEARASARIHGEHVAQVMDVGMLPDGSAYMVMEYLEGKDLEAYAQDRGPLPVSDAVDFVLQALQAVAQAHVLGIIHRDLKPSNLFLAKGPDRGQLVKVLDFGISKTPPREDGAPEEFATASCTILGSPAYMAPEQARSARTVDVRADIWAIGVILYRLVSGRLPFVGDTMMDLLMSIVQDVPMPLSALRRDLPAGFESVVTTCLSKEPVRRYANVGELAFALRPFARRDGLAVDRIARTLGAVTQHSSPATQIAPVPMSRTIDARAILGAESADGSASPGAGDTGARAGGTMVADAPSPGGRSGTMIADPPSPGGHGGTVVSADAAAPSNAVSSADLPGARGPGGALGGLPKGLSQTTASAWSESRPGTRSRGPSRKIVVVSGAVAVVACIALAALLRSRPAASPAAIGLPEAPIVAPEPLPKPVQTPASPVVLAPPAPSPDLEAPSATPARSAPPVALAPIATTVAALATSSAVSATAAHATRPAIAPTAKAHSSSFDVLDRRN